MASSPKFQAPKGTRDFFPPEMAVRRHIESAWRSASIDCGFDEIEGPTFEHLELYTVKSGQGIVNELFSFRRAGGDNDFALRPEFTPTLARMAAAKGASLALPTKWFAIPVHFRAERPQRGRLREFVQWNVDLIGPPSAESDAEVIGCAILALERLGLGADAVRVKLSHRGAVAAALRALGVPDASMAGAFELLDRRDRLPPEEFAQRAAALALPSAALARFNELARKRVPLSSGIDGVVAALGVPASDVADLAALVSVLEAMDLAAWCEFDLGIVRGLAYYTGVVFEIHEASGAERAIAGGGRYDGLIELFGGPSLGAVGFGMGDVVLGLTLADRGLLAPERAAELLPRPDCYFISADPAFDPIMHRLRANLRRAGLHARHSAKASRNIGKLLGDAAKCRARFACIVGAEASEGQVALKDMATGEQRMVAAAGLATLVAR
ncbi:MAG: histidine--tRNA ligase [Planctomycetes bacterium]|nr:histidine--tRNA ligase [Planctomycetota bacterium]